MDDDTPDMDVPEMGGCIASHLVASGDQPIRFFYRDTPVNDIDSGWCFLSGVETDEEMADPESQVVIALSSVVAMEPEIAQFLSLPVGSVFERSDENEAFVPVTDWTPGQEDE